MPRKQVYGKKGRAIYHPLAAAFSSPDNTTQTAPKRVNSVKVAEDELQNRERKECKKSSAETRVLKSRSANIQPLEVARDVERIKDPGAGRERRKDPYAFPAHLKGISPTNDTLRHSSSSTLELETSSRRSEHVMSSLTDLPSLDASAEPADGIQRVVGETEQAIDLRIDEHPIEIISSPPVGNPQPLASTNIFEEHCRPILDLSPHPLTDFESWSSEISQHFAIVKIAEASFGEVYRLSLTEDISQFSVADESVFKVIALNPPDHTLPLDKRKRRMALKRAEDMSKPGDVANEVKLLQRMSSIPGFTNFRDVRIVRGRPPTHFIHAYKTFNAGQKAKNKEPSHFPDPSKTCNYSADQLWAVIEMQDAGTDLERLVEAGQCTSVFTVWDIFWQVVLSLAKGEEGAEFEHRDLHLGNVCVRNACASRDVAASIDVQRKLNFTAAETTIIDYTISRCVMPDATVAFHDLAQDTAVFEGDSTEEYQYDIYRYMRSALFLDNAAADYYTCLAQAEASGRSWRQYHPQTNLVWLHLVLYELLEQVHWPSADKRPSKRTAAGKAQHAIWKKAQELEAVLLRVQDVLDPARICANGTGSAGDLVALALGEGWIDVEDIIGAADSDCDLVEDLKGLMLG